MTTAAAPKGGKVEPLALDGIEGRRVPRLSLVADDAGKLSAKLEAGSPQEFAAMFGATGLDFADQVLHDLTNVALLAKPGPGPVNAGTINAMLQAVGAAQPADELEAMIAVQMAAFHHVTMDSLRRAQNAANGDIRARNLGQANKCGRTFAVLLEALNRHRGKVTTQKVIVENVNVNAGGQAVVGAVAGVGVTQ
jgi:hypothetical protein